MIKIYQDDYTRMCRLWSGTIVVFLLYFKPSTLLRRCLADMKLITLTFVAIVTYTENP